MFQKSYNCLTANTFLPIFIEMLHLIDISEVALFLMHNFNIYSHSMKKTLLLILIIFSLVKFENLSAQSCANYAVTRTTGTAYTSIATTGNQIFSWRRTSGTLANQQDDNRSFQIPIGFDFPVGHISDNQALIVGANVQLNVDEKGSQLSYIN